MLDNFINEFLTCISGNARINISIVVINMSISKEKIETLHNRMKALKIEEEDLIEKFILGSGKGGQKINKTSSCVYLKHILTGIEIKCQQERSRDANRFIARMQLCQLIEERLLKEQQEKKHVFEKIRRQKRRRTKAQQEKTLESKRKLSEKKSWRKPPRPNSDL